MSQIDTAADLRALAAIAQIGLRYAADDYDKQRYGEIRAIAARLLAACSDRSASDILASLRMEEGYPTPKIEVRAGIFRDAEVLLVQESADRRWSLPGGWADINLTLRENVRKEVKEETGLDIDANELSFIHDRRLHNYRPHQYYHIYKFFFLCSPQGESMPFSPSREVLACAYFPLASLPALSEERVSAAQIMSLHERSTQPRGPTWLD
jgi:ADP-ribose pyrophosphatase YjhB (NUDIX family)